MSILNKIIGVLLITFNLYSKSCNSLDVYIRGYFNTCINLMDAQYDLIIEIDNQSDTSFYVNTMNLFYKMDLVRQNGEKILPTRRGGTLVKSDIILIVKGKHEYKLSVSGLDRYDLREEIYWLRILYKNTQKSIHGKKLLVGEYKIPKIKLEICK